MQSREMFYFRKCCKEEESHKYHYSMRDGDKYYTYVICLICGNEWFEEE